MHASADPFALKSDKELTQLARDILRKTSHFHTEPTDREVKDEIEHFKAVKADIEEIPANEISPESDSKNALHFLLEYHSIFRDPVAALHAFMRKHTLVKNYIDEADNNGHTPLHYAVMIPSTKGENLTRALLEYGADPEAINHEYKFPDEMSDCNTKSQALVREALWKRGALGPNELNSYDKAGYTPLHYGAMSGDESQIHLLRGRGAKPLPRKVSAWASCLYPETLPAEISHNPAHRLLLGDAYIAPAPHELVPSPYARTPVSLSSPMSIGSSPKKHLTRATSNYGMRSKRGSLLTTSQRHARDSLLSLGGGSVLSALRNPAEERQRLAQTMHLLSLKAIEQGNPRLLWFSLNHGGDAAFADRTSGDTLMHHLARQTKIAPAIRKQLYETLVFKAPVLAKLQNHAYETYESILLGRQAATLAAYSTANPIAHAARTAAIRVATTQQRRAATPTATPGH